MQNARDYLVAFRQVIGLLDDVYRPGRAVELRVEDGLPTIVCADEPGPYTVSNAAFTLGKFHKDFDVNIGCVLIVSQSSEGVPLTLWRLTREVAEEYYRDREEETLLDAVEETAVSVDQIGNRQ